MGPWFKLPKKDPLADAKTEKKYIDKEVKNLRRKHSRAEKLSPLAQRSIEQRPPSLEVQDKQQRFSTERIPGLPTKSVMGMTRTIDREMVPKILHNT